MATFVLQQRTLISERKERASFPLRCHSILNKQFTFERNVLYNKDTIFQPGNTKKKKKIRTLKEYVPRSSFTFAAFPPSCKTFLSLLYWEYFFYYSLCELVLTESKLFAFGNTGSYISLFSLSKQTLQNFQIVKYTSGYQIKNFARYSLFYYYFFLRFRALYKMFQKRPSERKLSLLWERFLGLTARVAARKEIQIGTGVVT